MIDKNILWSMTFSPTGKIIKEPTFLGAVLEGVLFAVVLVVFVGAIMYL